MYSRFSGKPPESIQIPDHYSGCAFSPSKKETPSKKPIMPQLDVAKPSPLPPPPPPPPPSPSHEEPHIHREEPCKEPPREEKEPPPHKHMTPASPLASWFGGIGSSFPFGHGVGFEELLILGLILLLSQTESDSHLVLMLGLLLFCG
ncbi:MAG: hypothetical protein IJW16_02695 [Clostridia bacterium]|nr:hypothetical protein [Clostridia bacterium]